MARATRRERISDSRERPARPFTMQAAQLQQQLAEANPSPLFRNKRRQAAEFIPHGKAAAPETLAVAITVHPAYMGHIQHLLQSWESHLPNAVRRVLVLDNCRFPAELARRFPNWKTIEGSFGHPGPARNAALDAIGDEVDWILYWDADNVPPSLIYAGIAQAAAGADSQAGVLSQFVDHPQADPRHRFIVDTASLWRKQALRHVGGWPQTWLEDWHLANKLFAAGWTIDPLPLAHPIVISNHPGQRSKTMALDKKLWSARSIGIITLLRGNAFLFEKWLERVKTILLPEQCGLTIVVDDDTPEFLKKMNRGIAQIEDRFQRVTVLKGEPPLQSWRNDPRARHNFEALHNLVARYYSRALAATPEQLVLSWEDDTIPRTDEALARLAGRLLPNRVIAAVGALYCARQNSDAAVASRSSDAWIPYTMAEIPPKPMRVGMLAGGFTLYVRQALESVPFQGARQTPSEMLGWDGNLSRALHTEGWEMHLDGSVRCTHLIEPSLAV